MFQNIFRIDSIFYRIGTKIGHLLVLNLLMILTSLPIVTIGAAQTAGFDVTKRMILFDENKIISTYIQSFKKNIKISTLMMVILVGVFYFLWIDWQFLLSINGNQPFIFIGVFIVTILTLNSWQYAFFYQATYNDTIQQTFKNTLKIFIKRPFISLFSIVLLVGPYILLGLSGYLIIFGLYVHLFIGFSFHLYLRTFILLFIFNKEKEFYS